LATTAITAQAWVQTPSFQVSSMIGRSTTVLLQATDSKKQREPNKEKGEEGTFRRIWKVVSFSSDKKEEPPIEEDPGFFGKLLKRKDEDATQAPEPQKSRMSRIWGREKSEEKLTKKREKEKPPKERRPRKEKAKAETKEKVSESPANRLQALFTNTKARDEEGPKEAKNRTSTNTLSVVQKFVSNLGWGGGGSGNEEWVPVFPKTRISPGQMVPVTVAGIDLLVIAAKDGRQLYCIANSCPHLGTPLETGKLVRLPVENNPSSPSLPPSPLQPPKKKRNQLTEVEVSSILQQDGCEDCIVCPLHRTAFALESGQVRGEWCPYPPVLGKVMGAYKGQTSAAVFDVRYRGKNVEVRINSPIS